MRRLITLPSWSSVMMKERKRQKRREPRARMTHGMWYNQCVENNKNALLAYNVTILHYTLICLNKCCFLFSSVSSRGPRMPPLQPLVLEPQTAVETPAAPLPLMLTMAPNLPPASQDGPRREAVAGGAREHQPTTRYRAEQQQKGVAQTGQTRVM